MSGADYTEIKAVPDVPDEVLRAAASGRLVVFAGAGVSRIIGCPSWEELARKQLEDLREKGAINYYEFQSLKEYDPRRLLSICKRIYEDKNISGVELASLVGGDKDRFEKYAVIYDALYAFNAVYVTTNYDDYLDRLVQRPAQPMPSAALPGSPIEPNVEIHLLAKVIHNKDALLLSILNNGNVIHLHGSINDENNAVVTIVDYMEHYKPEGKPATFLKEVFTNYVVLFVGYGLEEYEILEFIITKSNATGNETRHFMLYPVFTQELNLLKFQDKYYSDLGVQVVPYPIDQNGHEQLVTVLQRWAEKIGPMAKPQGFYEKVKLIDEVI
jgi:hypothetical protein